MRSNQTSRTCAGAFLLLASLTGAAFADSAKHEDATSHPDLSGHWVLNEKASDMPHFGGGQGGEQGGTRGGGGGGGWGHGGGRGNWDGGGSADARKGEAHSGGPRGGGMGLPGDMVVEQADDALTVSVRGLAVRKLTFGEVKAPEAPPANGAPAGAAPSEAPQIIAAHWDRTRVVSRMESRRGGTIDETWELAKDGRQLVVRTTMPAMGDRPAREMKRVYDRAE